MVKRLFCIGICLFFVIGTGIFPAQAQEARVYDDADLFTAQEESQLEDTIAQLRESTSLDLVIVTVQGTGGKDVQTYADDFYDAGGFGVGSDYSGALLLIDMGASEVAISTCGSCIGLLSDTRIDAMLDSIVGYLSQRNFLGAGKDFLEKIRGYSAQNNALSGPSEKEPQPVQAKSWLRALGIAFPISLGLGGLVVWILYLSTGKSGKRDVRPRSYRHSSFLDLSYKNERLIDKRVITRRIPRPQNTDSFGSGRVHGGGSRSFGGSSTHMSSSGRSHGGGSRKF